MLKLSHASRRDAFAMPARLTSALILLPTLSTGCSRHNDPENPQKNPHPVQRYEVTATVDKASGPWDEVSSTTFFNVVSLDCTHENKFLGVHIKPTDVPIEFKMNRMDEKTWKGYFYRDAMLDEDYYGLGVCHWNATSVSVGFTAQGVSFSSGSLFEYFLKKGAQTEYFKKSNYGDTSLVRYGTQDYSSLDPDVAKHPDAYFQIAVAVKEVVP